MKFQVGDRVKVRHSKEAFDNTLVGSVGTVTEEILPAASLSGKWLRRYYVALGSARNHVFAFWEHQLETAVLDELARIVDMDTTTP